MMRASLHQLVCVLCLLYGAARTLAQDCSGWWAIGDPQPRSGAAMAYDSARGVVVLFGGTTDPSLAPSNRGAVSSETWEFDGARWQFRSLDGPTPRHSPLMAYDAERHRCVMTGGNGPTVGNRQLTWEWNGAAWVQAAVAAPISTFTAAFAYMPGRGVVLLSSASTEGFAWNGTAWVSIGTIPSMSPQSAVYDPVTARLIVTTYTALYAWDGSVWSTLASASGMPSSLAFDPQRGRVIGVGYTSPLTVQELIGSTWTPAVALPSGVARPTMTCWPGGGALLMSMPGTVAAAPVCWRVTASGIEAQVRIGPPPAEGPAASFDPLRRVTVVTGGNGVGTQVNPGTWELRGETWKRYAPPLEPGGARGGMAYSPTRQTCIYAGGSGPAGTWEWNGAAWSRSLFPNSPSSTGSLVWNAAMQKMVWMGSSGQALVWAEGPWTAGGSINGLNPGLVYDPVRATVIAAGCTSGFPSYRQSGATWPTLMQSQTTSSYNPFMAYVPSLGGVILFGGFSSAPQVSDGLFPNRTYFLGSQASAWVELPKRGPFGRKFVGAAEDTLSERVIMHAGLGPNQTGYNPHAGTWVFSSGPAAIAIQPADTVTREGGQVEIYVIAKGGGPFLYQWSRNGLPIAESPRMSGVRSDTLVIAAATRDDAGDYSVTVSNACATVASRPATLRVSCYNDFNGDGDIGTDQDIEAFFRCLAGDCCAACGTADFNGDGDTGTDGDIEAFFRVLAGGAC